MSLFEAIGELCTMPLRCANELVKDVTNNNDDEMDTPLCVLTLGASSILKGVGKTIEKSVNKLDD